MTCQMVIFDAELDDEGAWRCPACGDYVEPFVTGGRVHLRRNPAPEGVDE